MTRDLAAPLLACLLAVVALPSAGLELGGLLPDDPQGALVLGVGIFALFLLCVAPSGSGRGLGVILRPITFTLASLPFFAFVVLSTPRADAVWTLPGAAVWSIAVVAMALSVFPPRVRFVTAALVASLVGGGVVLAGAGLDVLPRELNPLLEPTASASREAPPVSSGPIGLRPLAPTRAARPPYLAEGKGPWWVPAAEGRLPLRGPVLLALDGGPGVDPSWRFDGVTIVHGSEFAFRDALDLDAFDAIYVKTEAWDETDAAARSLAVSHFVRRGGLLIGPPLGDAWPPLLDARLRQAGHGEREGVAGMRRLGLGRVVRAVSSDMVFELLRDDLWVRPVFTVFDRTLLAPVAPDAFPRWRDDPDSRRPAGWLLAAYALALLAFGWLLRGDTRILLGTLLLSFAAGAGVAWITPTSAGPAVEGLLIDLGGKHGRRIEAVHIAAGPAGFRGPVRFSGGGFVRLLGGRLLADGTVAIGPNGAAWAVRETTSPGPALDDEPYRFGGFTRGFLTGEVDPKRLRYGRVPQLSVRVGDAGPVGAYTLLYRAP